MRTYAMRSQQRGLSFFGLVFLVVFIVCVVAVGVKSLPILTEYQAAVKAAHKAAHEGNTVAEVRGAFDRAAAIDDINSIAGKDLEVTKVNDKIVVRFQYSREIALFGPAYLVYKFDKQTN